MTRRKSRRKWKIPRRIFKMKSFPEIERYEEEIVHRVLVELGGATAHELYMADVDRFRSRKAIAVVCERLVRDGRVTPSTRFRRATTWTWQHANTFTPVYGPERNAIKTTKRRRRKTNA